MTIINPLSGMDNKLFNAAELDSAFSEFMYHAEFRAAGVREGTGVTCECPTCVVRRNLTCEKDEMLFCRMMQRMREALKLNILATEPDMVDDAIIITLITMLVVGMNTGRAHIQNQLLSQCVNEATGNKGTGTE